MIQDTAPLVAVAALVITFVFAVVLVEAAHRLRDGKHERNRPVLYWTLRSVAWGTIAVHLACLYLGYLAALTEFFSARFPAEDVVGFTISFFVSLSLIAVAILLLATTNSIGCKLDADQQNRLNKKLAFLTVVGWAIGLIYVLVLGIAVVSFVLGPFLILGGLLIIVMPVAVVQVTVHNQRSRQARLLWVLAIAVEKEMQLPEEIERHANALVARPPHRWKLWQWISVPGRRRYRERLCRLAEQLREGTTLADALEKQQGLTPQFAVAAARIGNETETLGSALTESAVRQIGSLQYLSVTPSASHFVLYCWAIFTIMTGIVGFQAYYIVPKLKKIFMDFGTELPGLTVALIKISDFCAEYMLFPLFLILPAIFAVYAAGCYYRGWDHVTALWLMRWFPRLETAGILRNLKRVVVRGHPLSLGLSSMAAHHQRASIRERLDTVQRSVEAGLDCWQALSETGLLNPQERDVLQAAERAGNLAWALEEMADSIERRREYRLLCRLEIIRPIAVFVLGAIVAFICIALFMPLVKLLNDLS